MRYPTIATPIAITIAPVVHGAKILSQDVLRILDDRPLDPFDEERRA
jgi:hypothetical protein